MFGEAKSFLLTSCGREIEQLEICVGNTGCFGKNCTFICAEKFKIAVSNAVAIRKNYGFAAHRSGFKFFCIIMKNGNGSLQICQNNYLPL